ncbi:unnamed protein product [Cuscuta campestris]|uniref:High mobility group B protein 6 n=1 Tax=Cuscuta campestris TaxID=132261 RepID=A0A484L483_9ASTE|nr:unnamed protein product [Cuscuta campestris]
MLAQSPVAANSIQRPKPAAGRKPLQPTNSPANRPPVKAIKPKLKPDPIETLPTQSSNKENVHPLHAPPAGKTGKPPGEVELRDSSLADELGAIREKLERLRIDKQMTEKMLRERDEAMDLRMKELMNRGEIQKELELEVDRLFRLNELRISCTKVLPIRSLRDRENEKKEKEDQIKEAAETEDEERLQGRIAPSSPSSDLDSENRKEEDG